MTQVTLIDGNSWPESGSANAGSTGLDTLSGTWTHVKSTNVPPKSDSNGYIALTTETTGDIKIDPNASIFQGGDVDYWVELPMYLAVIDADNLPADQTNKRILNFNQVSTTKMTLEFYYRSVKAFTFAITESMAGGNRSTINGAGTAAGGLAVIPLDRWFKMQVHVKTHATEGRFAFFVNGVLLGEITNVDTVTEIDETDMASDLTFKLGHANYTGLEFRVAGPIKSWSGIDYPLRPDYDYNQPDSYLEKRFTHFDNDADFDQGRLWKYSGTTTITPTDFGGSGVIAKAKRTVITGSTSSTFELDSIDDLKLLPFNEYGWATICLNNFYLPFTSVRTTLDIKLMDSVNPLSEIAKLSVNSNGKLSWNGNELADSPTLASNIRYALALHLNKDGRCTWSLYDLTSQFSVQVVFSGDIGGWNKTNNLGKLVISGVKGDGAPEIGQMDICRWLEMVGLDSMVHAAADSVSPNLAIVNHISAQFSNLHEPEAVPGGVFTNESNLISKGFGKRVINIVVGRAGNQRTGFTNNTITPGGLDYLNGCIFWNLDGGSINDVTAAVADDTEKDARVDRLSTETRIMVQKLLKNNNKIWLSTMIRRNNASYSTLQNEVISRYNQKIREMACQMQKDRLITLSDVAAEIEHDDQFTVGDDVHFDGAGDVTYASKAVNVMTVMPTRPGNRLQTTRSSFDGEEVQVTVKS